MELTDVSKTAIATLRSHVIESQKRNSIINDPMAAYCLEKLISLASEKEKFSYSTGNYQHLLQTILHLEQENMIKLLTTIFLTNYLVLL